MPMSAEQILELTDLIAGPKVRTQHLANLIRDYNDKRWAHARTRDREKNAIVAAAYRIAREHPEIEGDRLRITVEAILHHDPEVLSAWAETIATDRAVLEADTALAIARMEAGH